MWAKQPDPKSGLPPEPRGWWTAGLQESTLFFSSAIIAYQMLLHQFLALCISPPVNIGHLWLSPQPFAPVSPFLTLQGGTSL